MTKKSITEASLDFIRTTYGVPAKKGVRVRFEGEQEGVITGASGRELLIQMDGSSYVAVYHPVWQLEYFVNSQWQPVAKDDHNNEIVFTVADMGCNKIGVEYTSVEEAETACEKTIEALQAIYDMEAEHNQTLPRNAATLYSVALHAWQVAFESSENATSTIVSAAQTFELQQAGAGLVTGSKSDCEDHYSREFEQWLEDWEPQDRDSLKIVVNPLTVA